MMPQICPRPCSRLTAAAVFIAVGVVQTIVGIILLRSKYVYLLAGPDFWTSISNVAVGSLLGVSASVWKQSKKRRSRKGDIRRNLLMALLFSALMINSTTLGIYLLGQGSALMSIHLESGQKYDAYSFASDVLAYAYVTSLCCPIICIVVAIVSMSGSFFSYLAAKESQETKMPANGSENGRVRLLRWVGPPELLDMSKKKFRDLILSSSSESADEDDSKHVPAIQKRLYSEKDIQLVLNRMAQGKRDSILSDSAIMLRQMDLLRRSRGTKLNQSESSTEPILPLSNKDVPDEICQKEFVRREDSKRDRDLPPPRPIKHQSNSEDSETERVNYVKNMQLGYPSNSEKLLNEYRQAASKLAHHYPSMYKQFRETLKNTSAVDGPAFDNSSDISDNETGGTAGGNKGSKKFPEADQNDIPTDFQINREISTAFKENIDYRHHNDSGDITSSSNDCFSPDKSVFGADSTFDVSKDSEVEEVIPVRMEYSTAAKFPHKLKPTAGPVEVPDLPQARCVRQYSEDSGIGNAESNSFLEDRNTGEFEDMKSKFPLFRENLKVRNNGSTQEYPKVGTQSMKRFDLNKLVAMESISEEPDTEQQSSEARPAPQSEDLREKGAIPKVWRGHLRNKSLSCIETGPSRQMSCDVNNSAKIFTPRKKRTTSNKALRNMWSGAASEKMKDFRDQVVDGDSLIGLSEEELIERQLRTRSIRKSNKLFSISDKKEVEKRMKARVTAI